uniref:DUF2428 domain-containing protein n=1 Tax=Leptobrachium leishanense TaxID=445787 RepID=A0A8C5N3X0_9ANUR
MCHCISYENSVGRECASILQSPGGAALLQTLYRPCNLLIVKQTQLMAAPMVLHAERMLREPEQCFLYYNDRQMRILSLVIEQLKQFAEASVKRLKDKHLDQAVQLLGSPEEVLGHLSDADLLPLLQYVLTCQVGACHSTSSFQKLEKLLSKLSQISPHLVSQERESLLESLLQSKNVLQPNDIQTVCMYLERSRASQNYFKQHLSCILSKVSLTCSTVLQDDSKRSTEHGYLAVKMCLQLFRTMANNLVPLVWAPASNSNALQNILGFLMKVISQDTSRDTRLLAGTAVASLVNTAPMAELGAHAGFCLVQWLKNGGSGEVTCGELCVSVQCTPSDDVGMLALIRGILTCGQADVLTFELFAYGQNMTMLELLFPCVSTLCMGTTEQYYGFQVLCLWLQRMRDHIAEIQDARKRSLVVVNGDILSGVTQLLWAGAEIPVDGLSGLVLTCFQHCLHIHRAQCRLSQTDEEGLYQDMLQKIMETSWQSRSRYISLCALLPFLGPNKTLALYPSLPAHLFHCISTNYLWPPASETYRTIITFQRKEWIQEVQLNEDDLAKCWAVTWLTPLCDALRSSESSLQCNAATHILPCTLSVFSECFGLIAEKLSGSSPSDLRGWVSLLCTQKVVLGGLTKNDEKKLQVCLESADDGVRLSALSYLCCSTRTSQPLSPQEIILLKKFLPSNLGCDNPGFRKQLKAVLRRAIERLRDGALSSVRRELSQEVELSQTMEFLEWLLQLSVTSISPAGNYQRRCSGLLIFGALLESCSDCWTPQKKKGQPPQDMSLLLNYAKQRGFWDFFSVPIMKALLACIQDSTNEIREIAADLLVRFFSPMPVPLSVSLFELGKASLCSPRVPLAEVGALLMKTLLQSPQKVVMYPEDEPVTPLRLVTVLKEMLEEQYMCAQNNMLQAARSKPLHGVLSGLRLCLLEVPSVSQSFLQSELTSSWCSLLSGLLITLREIAAFILNVLHKTWDEDILESVAPSFADMGKAVSTLIAHGIGQKAMPGSVLLSEEHSLIMTCCWVSLKEIGLLLGPLVEKLISTSVPLLSASDVRESVMTYQDIFMRCRHWVLAECRSQQCLSITRRAAGFPVLLQSILCADGSQKVLLPSCVRSLLTLAKESLPPDWDQTKDLPQVSAVHALQTMLHSSALRSHLLTYAVTLMSLALSNLRSPCWSMRNAALQLFSALTGAMLGLSRSDGYSSMQSTLSVGALLRRFPGLKDVLMQELQDAQQVGKMLHPSLHPVLILLARLQPGGDKMASCFVEPLLGLARNPIYAVRLMAARAIVPIVEVIRCHTQLSQLVQAIPEPNEAVTHNALHGCLLQIHALLAAALKENCLLDRFGKDFARQLLQALWLLSPVQKCPLIQAAYLDVLSLLVPVGGAEYAREVREAVCAALNAQDVDKQVGSDVFHEACVVYLCNDAATSSDDIIHPCVSQLLQAGDAAMFQWLKGQKDGNLPSALGRHVRRALQNNLCSILLSGCASERLRQYLQTFVHVHSLQSTFSAISFPENQDVQCANILLSLLETGSEGPQLRGQALQTLSLLLTLKNLLQDLSICSRWLAALVSFTDPASSCEELRLSAAHALHLGGADLVRSALRDRTSGLTQLAIRAIVYGIDLLQDEERSVRDAATRFPVVMLDLPVDITMQSDRALLHLLKLLRDNFWDCEETFHVLLQRLPPFNLHSVLTTLQERSVSLYEEDEPNVFADPMFISSLLLPTLHFLLSCMDTNTTVLQWVKEASPAVREQIQLCIHWGQEQGYNSQLGLKAIGCPHVQSAVLGLLVQGQLLIEALRKITPAQIAQLGVHSSCLEKELAMFQTEFRPQGGISFKEILE